MPTSSFYNDNLFRTYPLVTSDESVAFPKKRLVGAKVLCSYGSPYEKFPTVSLVSWLVRPSRHRLTFRCTDGTTAIDLAVDVPTGTGRFEHVHSNVVAETSLRVTVGALERETESFDKLDLPLEPTCVLWLKHRGVRSVRLGNESRDRLPSVYDAVDPLRKKAYADTGLWLQEIVLADTPLLLAEGYNCALVLSPVDHSIRFQPQSGAGRGAVAEFVPLGGALVDGQWLPESLPDDIIVRPDGLPPHDRILRSFCGAPGPEVTAVANRTIQVRNDVDASTVSVGVPPLGENEC